MVKLNNDLIIYIMYLFLKIHCFYLMVVSVVIIESEDLHRVYCKSCLRYTRALRVNCLKRTTFDI